MLKVDLHLHTCDDPKDNIPHTGPALVDRAVALGFGALAITLHEHQYESRRLRDYARERGIVLLAGIERTVGGKHVLLINFPRAAEDVGTFDDLARLRRRADGLVVAPHPFYPHPACVRSLLDRHADLFDALEWSYFWTRATNFNAAAARWAAQRGKPIVGNSDLHDLRQLGRTFSRVDAESAPDAICEAIRAGRVTMRTEPVPAGELACVFGGMLTRGLRGRLAARLPAPQAGFVRGLDRDTPQA